MRKLSMVVAGATLLVFLTRWPLAPKKHLYHIDNVNFALALDDFNPALHQPQPPGDPLYVALTRLLRVVAPRPEILFPLSGVLGSVVALAVMWRLGGLIFESGAGICTGTAATVLLALNPIFWLAGVANYVRVYLALGAVTIALLVWRCWTAEAGRERRFFRASAAALGFFAGFRPELGVLLFPLVASSVRVRKLPFRQIVIGGLWLAATTIPWLAVTAYKSGGLLALNRLNAAYLASQSGHTSLLYGATLFEAARISAGAIYWTFLGAVSWFWIVPWIVPWVVLWTGFDVPRAAVAKFLAIWFLPPFLFHTLVHIHNPDHALAEIPVVCLLGGFVISRLPPRASAAALSAAAALNVVLFFYPAGRPFWASNYRIVQGTTDLAERVYPSLVQLRSEGPVVVLWKNAMITPREMKYYVPEISVVELSGRARQAAILLPPANVVWLDPAQAVDQHTFDALDPTRQAGPFHVMRVEEGRRFTVDGQQFAVTSAR
jgi:hypothetical protein